MSNNDKVLILHGWGGSDAPHWQAELAAAVAKAYGTVSFPLLDNCHFPSKNRWVKQLKEILRDFEPDTVVCHSLANTLWFWLCEEEDFMRKIPQIKRLFMVSPPSLTTDIDTIKTFFPCSLPKNLYAKEIQMIVSDNDPYIQVEEAKNMAEQYEVPLTVIKDAGHINADSGYGKWDLIENLVLERA
ncbi:alpha/beta hydrolase [Sulfurovum sp. XGS-02]|uniref:RBBP9/YdeN family alpha/beta hydrolase n=1 Tax=Sulfurovum sp. XGS-02 TaxID=2925411 RepID=UPI00207067CC|nr:alpha/beta hydrolase [Sulfurovum sp. XGS-02]UPT77682.1 alpha/beta hydrolase [Sulfurovum sp. XGS-02]